MYRTGSVRRFLQYYISCMYEIWSDMLLLKYMLIRLSDKITGVRRETCENDRNVGSTHPTSNFSPSLSPAIIISAMDNEDNALLPVLL